MSTSNPFFQEVIDAHREIQQWFRGDSARERLSPLLARFSPRFSMITPLGGTIDLAGLGALFSNGYGKRPGLLLEVDDLTQVAAWPGDAVTGYRETQIDGEGRRTIRYSTVVFEQDAPGRVVWRHLHETLISAHDDNARRPHRTSP